MTDSIQNILKNFSDSITKKGYVIEGLDLSYVDIKEKSLEIFTYSTPKYKNAVREGIQDIEIGSLLLSSETFNKKTTIKCDNIFLDIEVSNDTNDNTGELNFTEFSDDFSGQTNATHNKWISHYKNHKINGVYFFVGQRRSNDFDLVLFGVVNGNDKIEVKKKISPIIKN